MNCCDCRILFISNTKCDVEEVSCLKNCFFRNVVPMTRWREKLNSRNKINNP